MTPDEFKDEAEFEAFLQGKGELAELLRAMPQPDSPVGLDAAILAQAAAAAASVRTDASNDSFIAPAQRKPPSLLSRWRWPLGLAASVALMIPVFMLQWQGRFFQESEMSTAAPPAGPVSAAVPAPAQTPQAARADVRAKTAAKPRAAVPAEREAVAKSETTAAEPAPYAVAPAPAAMAKQGAAPGAGPQAFPQAAAPSAPAVREPAAAADALDAAARNSVAAKRALPAPQMQTQSADAPAPHQPDAWLARIDKLIKVGSRQQALDEWAEFKRAFPEYPVRKALTEQIEELKKESQ